MTQEVNAAIEGAFEGGATHVLVNDSHGQMANLLPNDLDQRAELILGRPKPMNMAEGLDSSFDAVFFVGYHSGAGHYGVLSHTVTGAFQSIRLNGFEAAEATLYGAYVGYLGVKVALLTGDDQMGKQCASHFAGAELVMVKMALGHRAAHAVSPAVARERIKAGAKRALTGLSKIKPFVIPGPVWLELDFANVAMADLCAIIPGTERRAPRSVVFDCPSIVEAVRWVNIAAVLGGTLACSVGDRVTLRERPVASGCAASGGPRGVSRTRSPEPLILPAPARLSTSPGDFATFGRDWLSATALRAPR
jgi:D-amino peptidase